MKSKTQTGKKVISIPKKTEHLGGHWKEIEEAYQGPVVRFLGNCWGKIMTWAKYAPGEVSGLGLVRAVRPSGGDSTVFEVYDVFILEQVCSRASTVLDDDALRRFMLEMVKAEEEENIKLWWHTHADFQVFWSQTDDTNIRKFRSNGYLVSVVVNKNGDSLARIDTYEPRLSLHNIPVEFSWMSTEEDAACSADIKRCVNKGVIAPRRERWSGVPPKELNDDDLAWYSLLKTRRDPESLDFEDDNSNGNGGFL